MVRPIRPSRATVSRLALLAIDTLAAAIQEANHDPVERTALYRLALGYLLVTGVTAAHQASTIWRLIGHEGLFVQMSCRQSHSGVMLDGMRIRARAIVEQ